MARVCLNALRSRRWRRELPLNLRIPDPVVDGADGVHPEHHALVADSVGLALLVVLQTLTPAERLAFVLHDVFAMPFDEIAPIVDRSSAATRQLASRARRRVEGASIPDGDLRIQRAVVDAFFAAAHNGDFDALLAVLGPDVVVRSDGGAARACASAIVRGAAAVAARAATFAQFPGERQPAIVNGAAGVVAWNPDGTPFSVMGFTVQGGKIVAIDALVDPDRLRDLDLSALKADLQNR